MRPASSTSTPVGRRRPVRLPAMRRRGATSPLAAPECTVIDQSVPRSYAPSLTVTRRSPGATATWPGFHRYVAPPWIVLTGAARTAAAVAAVVVGEVRAGRTAAE